MDMSEEELSAVTGAEEWSAESDDSVDIDMPMIETRSRFGCSRAKRKRKEADPYEEIYVARNAILKRQNKLLEERLQMMERDQRCSVEHVVKILNDHLIADVANRQAFMAFSSVDDKISYLKHMI